MKFSSIRLRFKLNRTTLALIALSAAILSFFLPSTGIRHTYYLLVSLLGILLGILVLEGTEEFRPVPILLFSFLFGAGTIILMAGLMATIGIPIRWWLVSLAFALAGIAFALGKKEPQDFRFEISPTEILLVILAGLALVSRVVSVKGFIAPILHDPISHATWAKQIADTGQINYFYSPGLHILTALGALSDGVSVATYTLRLTNLLNGLVFVPIYFFLKNHLKSELGAGVGAFLFLCGTYPADLFWASGKNGLITALPFLFLLLYVIDLDLPFLRKAIVANALVFILILSHYPLAAISLLAAFTLILLQKEARKFLLIAGGIGLGIIWGLLKYPYQVALDSSSTEPALQPLSLGIHSVWQFLRAFWQAGLAQAPLPGLAFLGFIGLAGVIYALVYPKTRLKAWLPLFFILYTLVALVINFSPLTNTLSLVYRTQIISFFIFTYLGLAWIANWGLSAIESRWPKAAILVLLVILLASVYRNAVIFSEYRTQQSRKDPITQQDLDAFNWMQTHIKPEAIILNNAATNERQFIVFASDSAAWLPVFTDLKIAMPFTEFATQATHDVFQHYSRLQEGTYTCEDIAYFLEKGITHYFKDKAEIYGPQFEPRNSSYFNLIYDENGIHIYEIIPCKAY